MRGANRRRRIPFEILVLTLTCAWSAPAGAQSATGEARNQRGDVIAIWEVEPAGPAACRDLLHIPWVFGDDFEISSTCRWSARVGIIESCAVCGDAIVSFADGEECDDGNFSDTDGCTGTCEYATCGDGHVWSGHEQCDPLNDATCLPNCVSAACGDGIVTAAAGENCDDGNTDQEAQCPYGTTFCTTCNNTCSAELHLTGPYCGDLVVQNPTEQCDDGNHVTESACPYGSLSCNVCGSGCTNVARNGAICGDGNVDTPDEVCDDRNASACGTCSADCRVSQPAAAATGLLVVPAGAAIADGESFTLGDATGEVLTFEFDRQSDGVQPGNVDVDIPGSPNENSVRTACVNAINNSPGFGVTAGVIGSQVVSLVQDFASSLGNFAIQETVLNFSFNAIGMSGGRAGNCADGTGCVQDSDCASAFCDAGQCEP